MTRSTRHTSSIPTTTTSSPGTITRRSFALGAAALAAGLTTGLSGCGGDSGSAGGKVTLHLWDTDTRPERTANLKQLIAMFEKANPGITIKYLGLPSDQYMQKISTAIATRATPDLLTPKASDIAALVAQNALEPLDERFQAGGFADQISTAMTDSSKAAAPDGALYLTPATSLADVIYYRADWFAAEGLKEPTTWDDFHAAATTLNNPAKGRFGYTLRGGNGFFSQFVEMVYPRAGVETFFTEAGVSTLNDPAIVAATQEYVAMFGKQTAASDLTADFKTMVAQFGAGGAAMLSHSIGSYPTLTQQLGSDAVKAVVPFPAANGQNILTGRMTTGFAMFRASKNKEAAWKFLAYTMGQEGNSFWAQKSGYLPGNKAVAAEAWVPKNQPMQAALAAEKLPTAAVLEQPFYLPEFSAITTTALLPEWQRVLQGKLQVPEFLSAAAAKLTEAQATYAKAPK